jgi:hypothetical protein
MSRGRRKKTAADYREDNIAASRRILEQRAIHERINPGLVEYAEAQLKRYGVPEVAPTEPPETAEVQERYAAGRKAAQQNIFDGRAAASGKDE